MASPIGPLTPVGAIVPYCSNAQSQLYVDVRSISDTLNDDGTRATAAQLAASPVWTEFLLSASGEIEMAAVRGARYQPSDLALLAASPTAGAAILRKMTAWLAFTDAWMRRRPADEVPRLGIWAYGLLDALGKGDKIFSFQENIDADLPDNGFENCGDDYNRAAVLYWSARYFGARAFTYRPGYWSGGCCGGCGGGCGDW